MSSVQRMASVRRVRVPLAAGFGKCSGYLLGALKSAELKPLGGAHRCLVAVPPTL